jgi:cytochrome d ubiquinol oxidase subunit II
MSAATFLLVLTWTSLTAYALLAGADFGAGVWDLLAGTTGKGRSRRTLIEHVIGPVWEANHVWLIFVLVLLWTCFPPVFAAIASTLYLPLTLAALGIIARGSAFAFRKAAVTTGQQRLFGATFAASSLVTPFFLGTAAGAIASNRVPPGIAKGRVVMSWLAPTPLICGALAVSTCAFLAAVYLTGDAGRTGADDLTAWFRRRALASGLLTGALSLAALLVIRSDAPELAHGLVHEGLPLVLVAVAAGTLTIALVSSRHYLLARMAAGLAVASVVWGWGVARYPELLPGLSTRAASALPATLHATTVTVLVGLVILLPSMAYLFVLFQRPGGR